MIKIRLINFFQFLALQQVARVKLVKRTFEKNEMVKIKARYYIFCRTTFL